MKEQDPRSSIRCFTLSHRGQCLTHRSNSGPALLVLGETRSEGGAWDGDSGAGKEDLEQLLESGSVALASCRDRREVC